MKGLKIYSEKGWVNITGMVGQHKSEWWVNMVRNLQCRMERFTILDVT
jgi:hypothetical protein